MWFKKHHLTVENQKTIRKLYATGNYTMQKLAGLFHTKAADISTIIHLEKEEEEYWKKR